MQSLFLAAHGEPVEPSVASMGILRQAQDEQKPIGDVTLQSSCKEEGICILDESTGVAGHLRKDDIRLPLKMRTASERSVAQRDGACDDEAIRA